MQKSLFPLFVLLGLSITAHAQLSLPPHGGNQKAEVSQYMGLARVTVAYSSPHVNGRVIWGNVVSYGLTNYNAGKSSDQNPSPWRAGANENTTITFSHDILIEGQPLKAGVYGLHMIPSPEEWTIIFSANFGSWGSFFYTPDEDVLRVRVKPAASEFNEWLSFNFADRLQNSCTLQLKWEQLTVPVKISVPDGDALYVQKLRAEARGAMGFQGPQFRDWHNWVLAANFCADRKMNLEEALGWLENYLSRGARYFLLFESKGNILMAMGKRREADAVMREAVSLPDATAVQIAGYGRSLIAQRRTDEANEILTLNMKRYPTSSAARMGMAQGCSARGEYKRALKFAEEALTLESNLSLRRDIETAIGALRSGRRIN